MSLRVASSRRQSTAPPPPGQNLPITDRFAVSGAGPYTLTHAPSGNTLLVSLDGLEQLPANYSIAGNQITIVGLTPSDYLQLSVTYSY